MKTKLRSGIMLLMMLGWNSLIMGTTYVITSTDPDSLRQAIMDANSHEGADTILFNIPESDPGFNESNGVWTIKPADLKH